MIRKIKNNYNHTIYACYLAYIVQAIINNFAPLLFLTFALDYDLGLDKITLITTINFLVQLLVDMIDWRSVWLLIVQILIFALIYMVLPNKRNKFMDSLPGALLASIGWQVFSNLYSVYVENFASYQNIYGSVYALALSMLWLYCCISILFYGAVLNRWLTDRCKE